MSKDMFDGFAVNVFLDEDGDYLARFVEMPNVSAFSDIPEKALTRAQLWLGKVLKRVIENIMNPSRKHRRGKDMKAHSIVPVDAQLHRVLVE